MYNNIIDLNMILFEKQLQAVTSLHKKFKNNNNTVRYYYEILKQVYKNNTDIY